MSVSTPASTAITIARTSSSLRAVARRFTPVAVLAAVACLVPLATAPAADASTPWGTGGAAYDGGIVCRLGAATVPMSTWAVDGTSAFATADVVKSGNHYGPAPASGSSSSIAPGQAGLDATSIAAVAYLIAHHGSGSARDVAETSADVALAAGAGSAQQRCLGQQGTSAAHAQALWNAAEKFAGPYTVQVGPTPHTKPLTAATVTATVVSASGAATPGVPVTFAAGTSQVLATTGTDGVARAQVTMPPAASTPIRATASAPVSLTYFASDPAAVSVAAPATFSGTGTIAAVLHPKPVVKVSAGRQLLLGQGTSPIVADITGSYGYGGSGTATLVGPVVPNTGKSCSSLPSNAFAHAATAWTGTFTFIGDGLHPAGVTSPLRPGCYATKADLTTSDSVPPVHAASGFDAAGAITVSTVQITTSTGSGIAPPGRLRADVAAQEAGAAKVSSTVTAYGPIVTHTGQCDGKLNWGSAPVAGDTTGIDLTPLANPNSTNVATTSSSPAPGGQLAPQSTGDTALTGEVSTPRVTKLGCYAFATRSTIIEDGKTLVVDSAVGSSGTTTLVMRPQLQITDGTYDAAQGSAMSGSMNVLGAFKYAGLVRVGLKSARPTTTGCRDADFNSAQTATTATTVRVSGDGDFDFHTPVASHNVCYAVTATLALDANHAVQAPSPDPTASSVFLAGVQLHEATSDALPHPRADGMFRPLVTVIGAGIMLLIVAMTVIGVGVASRLERR